MHNYHITEDQPDTGFLTAWPGEAVIQSQSVISIWIQVALQCRPESAFRLKKCTQSFLNHLTGKFYE